MTADPPGRLRRGSAGKAPNTRATVGVMPCWPGAGGTVTGPSSPSGKTRSGPERVHPPPGSRPQCLSGRGHRSREQHAVRGRAAGVHLQWGTARGPAGGGRPDRRRENLPVIWQRHWGPPGLDGSICKAMDRAAAAHRLSGRCNVIWPNRGAYGQILSMGRRRKSRFPAPVVRSSLLLPSLPGELESWSPLPNGFTEGLFMIIMKIGGGRASIWGAGRGLAGLRGTRCHRPRRQRLAGRAGGEAGPGQQGDDIGQRLRQRSHRRNHIDLQLMAYAGLRNKRIVEGSCSAACRPWASRAWTGA